MARAGGCGRLQHGDPLPDLGLRAGLERRAHDEHAIGRATGPGQRSQQRRGVLEVAGDQQRAGLGELPPGLGLRTAGQRQHAMPTPQQRPRHRPTFVAGRAGDQHNLPFSHRQHSIGVVVDRAATASLTMLDSSSLDESNVS